MCNARRRSLGSRALKVSRLGALITRRWRNEFKRIGEFPRLRFEKSRKVFFDA